MSFQDKLKMFSQFKINNPNIPSEPNESSKNNIKQKEMKKYLTKPILKPNDEKGKNNDKNKNNPKKDINDSNIQKDRSTAINNNNNINKNFIKKKSEFLDDHPKKEDNKKEKEKNVDKKSSAEIKESNVPEKRKCLELYFKLRNEGLAKANTEVSKGYCLTENNINC